MPDTFTHIAIPTLFSRWYKNPLSPPIVLIGTVLPDYLREMVKVFLPIVLHSAAYPLTSIIGIICVSLIFCAFFEKSLRKKVFLSLLLGQSIHIIFDMLQHYFGGGTVYLFLPYWKTFQIGIYSDINWIYIYFFSLASFSVYCLIYFKKRKHKEH